MADPGTLWQGLATAFVVDYVEQERKRAMLAAAVVSAVAVALVTLGPTWARWIGGLTLVLALIAATGICVVSRLTLAAVRRFAEPRDLRANHAALSSAIDRAGLPTGPTSAVRFAWSLRKGAGAELERLRDIAFDLAEELDISE